MDSAIYDLCVYEFPYVMRFAVLCGASLTNARAAADYAVAEAMREGEQGTWAAIPNQRAWLRAVAYRYCVMGRLLMTPESPAPGPPEGTWPHHGRHDLSSDTVLVLQAIHKLPADQRVVLAFRLDRFRVPVIAAHLSRTEQEVWGLLKEARKALTKQLAGMTTPEEEDP
jgi:DNA-directed RNA polymerase specialized sigma24 family protein